MAKPLPRPISVHEYRQDRDSAAKLHEILPGQNFKLRRALNARETFSAFAAKATGLAMEHDARIKSVVEFKGLFAVTVHFVTEDGELAHELRPIVNEEGIICKPRKPDVERGYFLSKKDPWDIGLENLTSGKPEPIPA